MATQDDQLNPPAKRPSLNYGPADCFKPFADETEVILEGLLEVGKGQSAVVDGSTVLVECSYASASADHYGQAVG